MKIHASLAALCLLVGLGTAFSLTAQIGGGPRGNGPGVPSAQGRGTPGPNFPSQANSQDERQQPTATIKTQTILVPVRVVVRDTGGRAVANLKKEDFKLYQDGKQQGIATFTSIAARSGNSADASAVASTGTAGPNAMSPGTPAAATRFITLFFDDLHMGFEDLAETRNAADKYLATLHPEDRVAIVTASGEGELDFTDDSNKLQTAMMKLQPHQLPGGPPSVVPVIAPCPPPMSYTEAYAIHNDGSEGVTNFAAPAYACGASAYADPDKAKEQGEAIAKAIAARTQIAGEEAINSIFERLERAVRRLSVFPGQRIVVLVSPGFIYGGHQAQFRGIINLAIRDDVVVNTLDARGVTIGGNGPLAKYGYGHDAEQLVLADLADSTGGIFIRGDNDYKNAMEEMSEQPENYYLLSYSPQNLPADGKYHILKVTLAGHSLDTVQARKGFYAPDGQENAEQAAKREIDDAIFSEEQQHDLPVKMETQVTRDASGAQKLSVKANVDPSQLHFNKADGRNQEQLTVAAAIFDKDGSYIDGTQKIDDMNLSDATLAQIEKSGFYLEMDFDVKPGDYTVRMVARDSNDQHMAVESAAVSVKD